VPALTFSAMPLVVDDEEVPFVLGMTPDPRPALEIGGARYRRGAVNYQIEWLIGGRSLRILGTMAAPNQSAVFASAGPLLNEWWPLLRQAGYESSRPYLSAGVVRRAIDVPMPGLAPVQVQILPAADDFPQTVAVFGGAGTLDDELTLLALHTPSLAVARAALQLMIEYRSLIDELPDTDLVISGATVPLKNLLTMAKEVADALHPLS
jgi:hypothetical protein